MEITSNQELTRNIILFKKLLLTALFIPTMAFAQDVIVKGDIDMCNKDNSSMFCIQEEIKVPVSKDAKDPYFKQLEDINNFLLSHWSQTPEKNGEDNWQIFTKEFINLEGTNPKKNKIKGDCEDLAMSAIEYAILKSIPKERLGRIIVKTHPAYKEGIMDEETMEVHMTAYYYSPETKSYYYFGDSYYDAVTRKDLTIHRPIAINWLTDGREWYYIK